MLRVDSSEATKLYNPDLAKEIGVEATDHFVRLRIIQNLLSSDIFEPLAQKVCDLLACPDKSCNIEVWKQMCLTALNTAKAATSVLSKSKSHQETSTEVEKRDPFAPLPALTTLFSRKDLTDTDRKELLRLFTDGFVSDEELPLLASKSEIGNGRIKHFALLRRTGLSAKEIFSLSFLSLLLEPETTERVQGFLKCIEKKFPIEKLEKWHPESLLFQFEIEVPFRVTKRRREE